eukprot:TRINITY_DN14746_c0_g1_i1.p1 TRINITY_DN14746_c0_g1~~TRINITY_DN14746_c0_g1_i1.p1  ORF type:complete len:209 (+),score=1.49 TRINITY_DN14746_c0_g1_i1:126-752(+)
MSRNYDRWVVHEGAMKQHLQNSWVHNYCSICDRGFMTPAALRGHEQVHLPRTIMCPNCPNKFPTASALLKHIEQTSCLGNFTHSEYVNKIREWEARSGNPNALTTPRLGWACSEGCVEFKYFATGSSWNGYAYECYFCPKECATLASLNQHLHSGVHDAKDFRCRNCGFTAVWLSAVIAHIESGKYGYMTRDQVREFAQMPFVWRIQN